MTRKSKMYRRLHPSQRQREILSHALTLASDIGYTNIKMKSLAEYANIAPSLIFHYFESMNKLKHLVVKVAIEREVLPVVAQAMMFGDKQTKNIDENLRKKTVEFLKNGCFELPLK